MKDGQAGGASEGKGKGGRANGVAGPPAAPALTGKERAQAIIDAAFAEVRQDMARKANAGQLPHYHQLKTAAFMFCTCCVPRM